MNVNRKTGVHKLWTFLPPCILKGFEGWLLLWWQSAIFCGNPPPVVDPCVESLIAIDFSLYCTKDCLVINEMVPLLNLDLAVQLQVLFSAPHISALTASPFWSKGVHLAFHQPDDRALVWTPSQVHQCSLPSENVTAKGPSGKHGRELDFAKMNILFKELYCILPEVIWECCVPCVFAKLTSLSSFDAVVVSTWSALTGTLCTASFMVRVAQHGHGWRSLYAFFQDLIFTQFDLTFLFFLVMSINYLKCGSSGQKVGEMSLWLPESVNDYHPRCPHLRPVEQLTWATPGFFTCVILWV